MDPRLARVVVWGSRKELAISSHTKASEKSPHKTKNCMKSADHRTCLGVITVLKSQDQLLFVLVHAGSHVHR